MHNVTNEDPKGPKGRLRVFIIRLRSLAGWQVARVSTLVFRPDQQDRAILANLRRLRDDQVYSQWPLNQIQTHPIALVHIAGWVVGRPWREGSVNGAAAIGT